MVHLSITSYVRKNPIATKCGPNSMVDLHSDGLSGSRRLPGPGSWASWTDLLGKAVSHAGGQIWEFQWEKSWEKWWLKWGKNPKKIPKNAIWMVKICKNDDQLDFGFGDTHGTRFSEPIKAGNEEIMSIIVLDFPELVVGLQNWPRLWSLDWVCRSRVLSGHWDIHITTVNPTSYKGG